MDYTAKFAYYSTCACGAITLYEYDGEVYSCLKKNCARFLPKLDLRKLQRLDSTYACDHGANRYGLYICACGSGEPFAKCEGGFDVCGKPMQILGGRTCVQSENAWLRQRCAEAV